MMHSCRLRRKWQSRAHRSSSFVNETSRTIMRIVGARISRNKTDAVSELPSSLYNPCDLCRVLSQAPNRLSAALGGANSLASERAAR